MSELLAILSCDSFKVIRSDIESIQKQEKALHTVLENKKQEENGRVGDQIYPILIG